jgi:hypothetical protein
VGVSKIQNKMATVSGPMVSQLLDMIDREGAVAKITRSLLPRQSLDPVVEKTWLEVGLAAINLSNSTTIYMVYDGEWQK